MRDIWVWVKEKKHHSGELQPNSALPPWAKAIAARSRASGPQLSSKGDRPDADGDALREQFLNGKQDFPPMRRLTRAWFIEGGPPLNLQQVFLKLDLRLSLDRKTPRAAFVFGLGETDMRLQLATIAGACALLTTPAFGQHVERVPASASRPSSPVVRENPAMATGFSPIVATALLDQVCKPARDDLRAADKLANSGGLRTAETPANLRWALPEGARVWKAQSLDSEVYLYAYGPKLTQCGVAILRPLRDVIALKLREQLTDVAHGYAVENEQKMQAGVRFTRFKAAGFRYADLMDYPANGETPGVLKIELLPLS